MINSNQRRDLKNVYDHPQKKKQEVCEPSGVRHSKRKVALQDNDTFVFQIVTNLIKFSGGLLL